LRGISPVTISPRSRNKLLMAIASKKSKGELTLLPSWRSASRSLGGQLPERLSDDIAGRLASGRVWALSPIHKIMAGLFDMYAVGGNREAPGIGGMGHMGR